MSRFNQNDDNPMLYVAWKLNFKGIMKELATTASEEFDLLCRWLGQASAFSQISGDRYFEISLSTFNCM